MCRKADDMQGLFLPFSVINMTTDNKFPLHTQSGTYTCNLEISVLCCVVLALATSAVHLYKALKARLSLYA